MAEPQIEPYLCVRLDFHSNVYNNSKVCIVIVEFHSLWDLFLSSLADDSDVALL
jgi:hypothetical protein